MLGDFFKLDTPFVPFDNSTALNDHFRTTSTLENVLFEPASIDEEQKTLFKNKSFKNVSFSKTAFAQMTFTDCTFEDCLFIGSAFLEVQFHRCRFKNCNFYKVSLTKCYFDPNFMEFDAKYRKTHANIMTELYHTLLINAKSEFQHRHAEDAEISFREWLILQKDYERRSGKIVPLRYGMEWAISKVGYHAYGYGNRPLRFTITSAIALLACSAIIHILWPVLGMHINGHFIERGSFLDSLYYTVVVTTTLGFGDVVPTLTGGRLLTSLLSILGIVWFSLLAAMVIKKVVR